MSETVNKIMSYAHDGKFTNEEMKAIIEGIADYLGLKTLTNFSKSEGVSPVAGLKRKNMRVIIAGHKFIVSNE